MADATKFNTIAASQTIVRVAGRKKYETVMKLCWLYVWVDLFEDTVVDSVVPWYFSQSLRGLRAVKQCGQLGCLGLNMEVVVPRSAIGNNHDHPHGDYETWTLS